MDTYIDRAMKGTNDLRPDFQRMLKDSAKKQWNYVLVYKLDRFSRDKYETTIHKHTLKMVRKDVLEEQIVNAIVEELSKKPIMMTW